MSAGPYTATLARENRAAGEQKRRAPKRIRVPTRVAETFRAAESEASRVRCRVEGVLA